MGIAVNGNWIAPQTVRGCGAVSQVLGIGRPPPN